MEFDLFGNDTRPHTYLILVSPSERVIRKVISFKIRLRELLNRDHFDLHKIPHITILEYFSKNGAADDEIIRVLKDVISSFKPFKVDIRNADYWKSGTLFIRVLDSTDLKLLTSSVTNAIRSLKKPVRPETREPHITISRFITESEIEKIDISEFNYQDSFVCDKILVLRKVNNEAYTVLSELAL